MKPVLTLRTAVFDKDVPFTKKEIDSIDIEKFKFTNNSSCEAIAYFGAAMYHAQMTEEALRQLIAFACDKKKQPWPEDIKSMSMGRLFDWIKKNLPVDYKTIGEKRIREATQARNFITHWIYPMALPSGDNPVIRKIFIACSLSFDELGMLICAIITHKYEPKFFHMRTVFFKEGLEPTSTSPESLKRS